MNIATIIMAFLMGLTGSLHCAGMCGPIIWIMPFANTESYKKWTGIFLYHIGRISIYALLGLLLFSFKELFRPHIQQYISIILGSMLLIVGVASFIPGSKMKFTLPWATLVQSSLSKFINRPGMSGLFISGALNGLLPCGLVYMALTLSVTAPSATHALALMYAFGIGTMPMLIALTILKGRLQLAKNWNMRHIVPGVMLVFGMLFLLRGMNLGIPYLSPAIKVEQNEVKASCCHKVTVKK
jgi:sulfite exporter TauE/SafE